MEHLHRTAAGIDDPIGERMAVNDVQRKFVAAALRTWPTRDPSPSGFPKLQASILIATLNVSIYTHTINVAICDGMSQMNEKNPQKFPVKVNL